MRCEASGTKLFLGEYYHPVFLSIQFAHRQKERHEELYYYIGGLYGDCAGTNILSTCVFQLPLSTSCY